MLQILLRESMAMPYLRLLDAGFSLQGPELSLGTVHLGFLVDKVELEQDFLKSTSVFFSKLSFHNIIVLKYPPYSPDLAPCDFYIFPKIKSVLKGTHFLPVEDVKAKTTEILNSLSESDLQNCFERWQHRIQLRRELF
ncbi:hypothetical protein B7P43_G06802 [Cryptotermes secundus]|uniref:Tc1-like transposase DDE domain-containing protein n=1 Tax=Cryptotermes secundus TaxID=105785 RepID=A0A2J7Q0N3_9NEOP|nr:hypothetical protein B7P43_G06802 [Cryptotermes secundus]